MSKRKATFTDQIRDAIRQCGKTRYAIAKETGIQQSSLCRFAAGTENLSLAACDRLAEAIGMAVVAKQPAAKQSKGKPKPKPQQRRPSKR